MSNEVRRQTASCNRQPLTWGGREGGGLEAFVDGPTSHDVRVFDAEGIVVVRERAPSSQQAAARIWAVATAQRDNEPEPAPVEAALPIIQKGLQPDDAILHLAYVGGQPAGFAVVVPQSCGLEILYLGVDPTAWGGGVASHLLSDVAAYAEETSRPEVGLWVYDDNARAVEVYRRAGWSGTDAVRTHKTSGRLERRHVRSMLGRIASEDDP